MNGIVAVVAASNRRRSNSAAIARFLADALAAEGAQMRYVEVAASGGLSGEFAAAEEALAGCRHVILVASLYHDTLNYMATAVLEAWAEHAGSVLPNGPIDFSAIVHSGYPEPVHTEVALAVCRRFAGEVGWRWRGGFTAGATSSIGGRDLAVSGPMTRHLRQALERTARAIACGEPVPEEAVEMGSRVLLPTWLFIPLANWAMRREARRAHTRDLDARPYA